MTSTSKSTMTIHRIAIAPLGLINAFLIHNHNGCILVDAGLPNTEGKVQKALARLACSFEDIKLIVVTHAHIDHAGNAFKLHTLSGAPIVAHEGDLPYFQGKKKMHFCPTGWFGKLFHKTGAIQKAYSYFTPDILLTSTKTLDLTPFGFDGEVIPTPGHTEGSLSVVLNNRNAIVGDLVSSGILLGGIARTGKAKRPPFEDDPLAVRRELQQLVARGTEHFHMGHGGPLPKNEILRHADALQSAKTVEHS